MSGIYNEDRMKCRTNIQQLNTLFDMGKQLEGTVDNLTVGTGNIIVTPMDGYIQITY